MSPRTSRLTREVKGETNRFDLRWKTEWAVGVPQTQLPKPPSMLIAGVGGAMLLGYNRFRRSKDKSWGAELPSELTINHQLLSPELV
jgi:hypothetical protein